MHRMKPKNTLYLNLWKSTEDLDTQKFRREHVLIEEVCFRANLAYDYEDYVKTVCDGMIMLLEAKISRESLSSHKGLMTLVDKMGDEIIDNSRYGSDQQYVGIFVKLRSAVERFKVKFYKMIKDLLHQVLENGIDLPRSKK